MVLNRSESGMGAVPPGLRWEAALGCALRRLAVIFTKGVEAPTLAQHWVGSQELGARRLEPRSPGAREPICRAGTGAAGSWVWKGRCRCALRLCPPMTCRLVWPGLRAPGTLGAQVQGPRGATALEGLEVGLTAPAPPCTAPPPARSAPRDTVARGRRRAAVPAAAPGQRRRPCWPACAHCLHAALPSAGLSSQPWTPRGPRLAPRLTAVPPQWPSEGAGDACFHSSAHGQHSLRPTEPGTGHEEPPRH